LPKLNIEHVKEVMKLGLIENKVSASKAKLFDWFHSM